MDLYIISLVNSLFFLDFLINSSLFPDKLLQSLAAANGWKGISHNLSSVVLSPLSVKTDAVSVKQTVYYDYSVHCFMWIILAGCD